MARHRAGPAAELAWLRDLRDAVGAYFAHRTKKYPDERARAAGFWVINDRLEETWLDRPEGDVGPVDVPEGKEANVTVTTLRPAVLKACATAWHQREEAKRQLLAAQGHHKQRAQRLRMAPSDGWDEVKIHILLTEAETALSANRQTLYWLRSIRQAAAADGAWGSEWEQLRMLETEVGRDLRTERRGDQ